MRTETIVKIYKTFDELTETEKQKAIDLELKWDCGSSYSFISDILFKDYEIELKEYDLIIETSFYYGKDEVICNWSFYTEDNVKTKDEKTLKDYQSKLVIIKDKIYKLSKEYETAFVYGWDDYFNDWLYENLIDSGYEYDTTEWSDEN